MTTTTTTTTTPTPPATLPATPASSAQSTPSTGWTEADPVEVRRWLDLGEAILIDVREPDEHARERIAGARSLPVSRFDPGLAEVWARPGQRIVLHCRGGKRSAEACRTRAALLPARGFALVSMTGGIEAWKARALPVEVGGGGGGGGVGQGCEVRRMMSPLRQAQVAMGLLVLSITLSGWLIDSRLLALDLLLGLGVLYAGLSGTCAMERALAAMPWNRPRGL